MIGYVAKKNHSFIHTIWILIYSLLTGYTLLSKPLIGIVVALLPFFIYITLQDVRTILCIFIVLLPLHTSPWMAKNIVGIVGAKPLNVFAVYLLVLFFYYRTSIVNSMDEIEKKTMIILGVYFGIFALCFFRSLLHLSTLSSAQPEVFHSSIIRYTLSDFIRPSLFILPFIYILKHITSPKDINKVLDVICYSIFPVSVIVVWIVLGDPSVLFNRGRINAAYSKFFGVHYNTLGTYYIILGPVLLHNAITKKKLAVVNYVLAFIAVCILQSRTSIILFVSSSLCLLLLLRQIKLLSIFGIILLVAVCFYLPSFLSETFSIGMESRDMNAVLSGRLERIWSPLFHQLIENPGKLLFGGGRYSMVVSAFNSNGIIPSMTHAHNAFIDFLIDNGLLLTTFVIFLLSYYIYKAWRICWDNNNPLCWSLLVSLLAYLVATFSGRQIYPHIETMYLLLLIPLLINHIRAPKTLKLHDYDTQYDSRPC